MCLEKNTFKYISIRQKDEYEKAQNSYEEKNLNKRDSNSSVSSTSEYEGNEEIEEKKSLWYHK